MRDTERAPAPAVEAEQMSPPRANPLLPLISPDPNDAWLLLEEVRRLPYGPLSAAWLDALLDDPRLEALPQVRDEAVQKLLDFGHPYALLINPEHLTAYRRAHPTDVRPRRLAIGAALAMVGLAAFTVETFDLVRYGIWLPVVPVAVGIVWSMAIGVRAMWTRTLRRGQVMAEVVLGLVAAGALIGLDVGTGDFAFTLVGTGLLPSVVPVTLAGLAGGWSES